MRESLGSSPRIGTIASLAQRQEALVLETRQAGFESRGWHHFLGVSGIRHT